MSDSHMPIQCSDFLKRKAMKMLIDGQWVESSTNSSFQTFNPATGEPIADVQEASLDDVENAVRAARRAFSGEWSRYTPYDRQLLLLKIADLVERNFEELSILDTIDMGAPLSRTSKGVQKVVSRLRYYAGMATMLSGESVQNSQPEEYLSYTVKEPVGVVGAIIPWNAPFSSSVWKIGPVLTTGCTMILKPAEEASLSVLRFGELLQECGVPKGVVNIVTGHGEVGAAIANHLNVDKIAFTGSEETGRKIIQSSAGNIKRISLELGGKSPNIVFADANMKDAVVGAAMACFNNSGQVCSAGTRLFVERKIYDEFVHKVAAYANELIVGNGLDDKTQIGPVVSRHQFDRVSGYLKAGKKAGATVLCGGEAITEGVLKNGYFIKPTLLADVNDDMQICREEIFGPVLSALVFDSIDEVIERANDTTFGLASGVWSQDVGTIQYVTKRLRAGTVWANCYQIMDPAMPFGGYKMSGYGRESGVQQLNDYMNVKSVWSRTKLS